MKTRNILLIFIALCVNADIAFSQSINLSDSLRHVLKHKPVFTAKFDTRNSFITGNSAKVYGIKAGFSYRKTLTIGIGYNFIGTDLTQPLVVRGDVIEGKIKMRYIAPFLEYAFYRKGPWEATIPVQLGFGRSFIQYRIQDEKVDTQRNAVILYEPGMTIEYKILNVIGLGCGVGYRIMLKNNRDIDQQFTSPVYVLRFRLIFDELYKKAKQNGLVN